jgi:hypothetical protein
MYEFYSCNSICFFLLKDHFIFNFIFTSKSLMEEGENPSKKSQKRKRNEKNNEKSQKLFIIQPTNLDQ